MRRVHPSQFRVLAALLLVGLLALTTACASSSEQQTAGDDPGSNDGNAEPFSFTDDRGEEVTLDKSSDIRVVAHEDAANALMHFGIKPVGIFGGAPLEDNPQLGDLDVSGIESLGEVWGEIDLEKLGTLQPDLIVSTFYPGTDGQIFEGGVYGFGKKNQQATAQQIAPILAMDATQPSSDLIAKFGELSSALGTDLESEELVEQKQEFDAAVEELKAAIAEKPDLDAVAVTPDASAAYFAVPTKFSDLNDYLNWGMNIVEPDHEMVSTYYSSHSWENAGDYVTDLVLLDARGYSLTAEEMAKYPSWSQLPAVKADQTGTWMRVALNYDDYTEQIEQLTAAYESAEDVA
jgi:iron complex transport system substrate-binding protein